MEDNQLSFDMTIQAMQNQTKINIEEILENYKITPKCKAWMHVPLCKMVPMPIIKHAFKINILKMEQAFHMRYKEGDKVFQLFSMN
jgi:hypothetical protein